MDDDSEDYGYYSRPRLQLVKGPSRAEEEEEETEQAEGGAWQLSPDRIALCSVGLASLALAVCTAGSLQFMAFWVALAFFVGPFAPKRATGGICRVGFGEVLSLPEDEDEGEGNGTLSAPPGVKKPPRAAAASSGVTVPPRKGLPILASTARSSSVPKRGALAKPESSSVPSAPSAVGGGKGDWTRDEWAQLTKLLVKFPRGTPQRWEAVARAFPTKRSTEDIIAASKFMQGSKHKDPYLAFVSHCQSVSSSEAAPSMSEGSPALVASEGGPGPDDNPTVQDSVADNSSQGVDMKGLEGEWTPAQERALFQALKVNPKDTPQRWDRVAEAVTGKSRAECIKRYSSLRDSLKAKKASAANGLPDDDDDS